MLGTHKTGSPGLLAAIRNISAMQKKASRESGMLF
jgi:hypothetical protein